MNDLKQSAVWNNYDQVREWLTVKWLTIPQVCFDIPYTLAGIKFGKLASTSMNTKFKFGVLCRRTDYVILSGNLAIRPSMHQLDVRVKEFIARDVTSGLL